MDGWMDGYLARKAVQIRSHKSMIWWPLRKSEPVSMPFKESKWPKPLEWMRPCIKWPLSSTQFIMAAASDPLHLEWATSGISVSFEGTTKWYLLLHIIWWPHPTNITVIGFQKDNGARYRYYMHAQNSFYSSSFVCLTVMQIGKNIVVLIG